MPERRDLPKINIKPREIPFDQIVAVKGRNPVGESLPQFGKVISDAMVQRANLIKMGRQTAAIESAMGAQPGSYSGMDPDQAMKIAQLQQQADLKKMMSQYTIPSYDAEGNVSGFTPVPKGMKPFGGMKPNADQNAKGPSFAQNKFNQDQWVKLGSAVNNLNASSRKVLGVASTNNMRADRALDLIDNPQATPEDKELVVKDLLSVMKGGSPDEQDIKRGMYGSYHQKAIQLLEGITAQPQALNQPAVMQTLKSTILGLKNVDNKVIQDNLGINAVAFEPIIKADPERWGRLTGAVVRTTEVPQSDQTQVTPQAQTSAPVVGGTFNGQKVIGVRRIK